MKTIKMIMILLSTIFIISCKPKIICGQIKDAEIKPVAWKDISFKFNRCRVRCFDVNRWDTLPLNQCPEIKIAEGFYNPVDEEALEFNLASTESVNFEIEACDGVGGVHFSVAAEEIRPKIKQLNIIKEDNCKTK